MWPSGIYMWLLICAKGLYQAGKLLRIHIQTHTYARTHTHTHTHTRTQTHTHMHMHAYKAYVAIKSNQ